MQASAQPSDAMIESVAAAPAVARTVPGAPFVQLASALTPERQQAASTVRIEMRRGDTSVVLHWPAHQAE